ISNDRFPKNGSRNRYPTGNDCFYKCGRLDTSSKSVLSTSKIITGTTLRKNPRGTRSQRRSKEEMQLIWS
ncbi:hypothetical protein HAX54_019359, partial [Datura stramonium]|nr:hypothetical protein [Datura stramonium]